VQSSEQVLALISGYPEEIRKPRKFLILQAAIDDSGKGGKPVFVLAGFVLNVYKWIVFADQWKAILDIPPKIEYFKMNEALQYTGQFTNFSTTMRDERVNNV